MDEFAQPANSGISQRITAELLVSDPNKSIAMEIINESASDKGADGDHREGDQPDSP